MTQLKWSTSENGRFSWVRIGSMELSARYELPFDSWSACVSFLGEDGVDEEVTVNRSVALKSLKEAQEWAEMTAKRQAARVILAFGGMKEFVKT